MARKDIPREGPKQPRQAREQRPPTQIDKGPKIKVTSIEDVQRKETESALARSIVKAFQLSLAGLFLLALIVIGMTFWDPIRGKAVMDTLLALFKPAGEFLLGVFNSLLGFIFGFYFGRRARY